MNTRKGFSQSLSLSPSPSLPSIIRVLARTYCHRSWAVGGVGGVLLLGGGGLRGDRGWFRPTFK